MISASRVFVTGLMVGAVLTISLTCQSGPPMPADDFHEDFEGDLSNWSIERCCGHSLQLVPDPLDPAAGQVLRTEVRHGDDYHGRSRAEIRRSDHPAQMGQELWYSVRVLIPESYNDPGIWEDFGPWLMQMHQSPDPGEDWHYPPLHVWLKYDLEWQVETYYSKVAQMENRFDGLERVIHYRSGPGGVKLGQWTTLTWHALWTHEDDGLLEFWIDGEQVIDYRGPTCFNDSAGPWPKLGIYRGSAILGTMVVYHDDYREAIVE